MAVQARSAGSVSTRHVASDVWKRRFGRIMTYGLLCGWGIVALFPLYWVVSTSIKSPTAVYEGPYYVPFVDYWPSNEGWQAATSGAFQEQYFRALGNSASMAIFGAALAILLGSMAGYGLARFRYKIGPMSNRDINIWFIAQVILPPATVIFPLLVMFKYAHLLDTQLGMILVYASGNLPLCVWIMQDHFKGMPIELEESAFVDGATRLQTFFRISLPLAMPGLIAAYLLVLVFSWNEYFMAVNLTSADAQTMPILIFNQSTGRQLAWWTMAAMATTSIAPMIVIGLVLEKYIVAGLQAGAIKG